MPGRLPRSYLLLFGFSVLPSFFARGLAVLAVLRMDQIVLYKDFRIRAYEDWSGQWLAEAKRPLTANPEYLATPSGHPTPEAAIDLVKQLIDSESNQDSPQTKPSNEDNSGSAMLDALRAEFPAHIFVPARRSATTVWVPDDDLKETAYPDYIEVTSEHRKGRVDFFRCPHCRAVFDAFPNAQPALDACVAHARICPQRR